MEDENKSLKCEYTQLSKDADDIEAQEARLLKDIAGQLGNLILITLCKYVHVCTYKSIIPVRLHALSNFMDVNTMQASPKNSAVVIASRIFRSFNFTDLIIT